VPVQSLEGWAEDDHIAAFRAFRAGCGVARLKAAFSVGQKRVCALALSASVETDAEARRFFEREFRAEILPGEGVLTGYFTPVYEARHAPGGPFTAPVRPPPAPDAYVALSPETAPAASAGAPPPIGGGPSPGGGPPIGGGPASGGLAPASASPIGPGLDLDAVIAGKPAVNPSRTPAAPKAQASAAEARPASDDPVDDLLAAAAGPGSPPAQPPAQAPAPQPAPVERVRLAIADRSQIDAAPVEDALAWMRPEELFFMQVQGSGVLVFEDGVRQRAVYAGDNGKPFVPLSRGMVQDGLIPAKRAGADGIRGWLSDNAGPRAQAVMNRNPRYVFFRLKPDDGKESRGAAGVPLHPGRSLAVDLSRHALGEVYWVDAATPALSGAATRYRRLAVALDTGGAIKGDIRADLYLGAGDAAGREAGRVRHTLRLARLTPLPVEASDSVEGGDDAAFSTGRP
jgi:membrane-bound lytic murein transglycosylase